jgi:hypothetical protein
MSRREEGGRRRDEGSFARAGERGGGERERQAMGKLCRAALSIGRRKGGKSRHASTRDDRVFLSVFYVCTLEFHKESILLVRHVKKTEKKDKASLVFQPSLQSLRKPSTNRAV